MDGGTGGGTLNNHQQYRRSETVAKLVAIMLLASVGIFVAFALVLLRKLR